MKSLTFRLFGLGLALLPVLTACTDTVPAESEDQEADLKASGSPKWIYDGLMPALEDVHVTVSLKGHTARVTGLLKTTFAGSLPFYAVSEPAGARTRVTVVYPVATGAVATSNGPGAYGTIWASPYVATTNKAAWGGFPFMAYNAKRGLAFHGPITAQDGDWHLLRGPVSHGCNRMQGEHVVELAHVFGIDMSQPHSSSENLTRKIAVDVIPGYDTWNGHLVDVDYPAQPGVVRPTGDVKLFKTWDSKKMLATVCSWNPAKWSKDPKANAHHCDYAGKNLIDPLTGL